MQVCVSCGFTNVEGVRFCGGCGERLEAAAPLSGRERKVVSVLFCDLVGFTAASDGADPEEVQAALSPYHARCRVEIERFGGTVEKFIGDAVMAAFGAPVVHEDDPERAVRAGLALLAAVANLNEEHDLGLSVRVGVATGEAVVSTGARPERGEGMLAGDVVNIAARLQTSAPVGRVLVGQATYESSRASIEYENHDPVVVKGKADPLSVWVAVRARGSTGEALTDTSCPMIGRDDELSALQRAFTRAVRENSVQLVTVVAEPGLGKSRLVQAFSDWVEDRDELVTWRQGRCPSYGDAVAYAAVGQIVKAQTAIADNDPPDLATAKLTTTVDDLVAGTDLAAQGSWLVARLSPLVGLPAAQAAQEESFTAWRRFLEALAAAGALVLVVEDLHWADRATLDFLTHLLEWAVGVPLVIITTARPELFDKTEHWGSGHRNATILTLAPLSQAENAQLVTSLLGTQMLPADLHAALLDRAAGNPLYTREYLNMLIDRTSLGAAPESTVADLGRTLPGSVRAVIAARLDTLPAEYKRLLQAAAVVGHTFWASAVAALTGTEQRLMSTQLHDLVRRDYVRPSRASSITEETEYVFGHALIADVAYQQLPRLTRAEHHRGAADWHTRHVIGRRGDLIGSSLENTEGDVGSTGGQAAVIAHHYTEAYTLSRDAAGPTTLTTQSLAIQAARWHCRACRESEPFDLTTALTHIEAALSLTPDGAPDLPGLLIRYGDNLRYAGRVGDAETVYQQAHALARDAGDSRGAAHAELRRAGALANLARLDEAGDVTEGAIAVLEALPASRELRDAYIASAGGEALRGMYGPALRRVDQALDLESVLGEASAEFTARAYRIRGSVRVRSGDPAGVDDLQRALEIAEAHDLTDVLVHANGEFSQVMQWTSSAQTAIAYGREAIRLARERGRDEAQLHYTGNLVETLGISGRLDDALAIGEDARDLLTQLDSPLAAATLRVFLAEILVIRGRFSDAQPLLNDALPVARGSETSTLMHTLGLAIGSARATGDVQSEAELTNEMGRVIDDAGADALADSAQYLVRLAPVLCGLGHQEAVRRIVEAAPSGLLFIDNNVLTARAFLSETTCDHDQAIDLHTSAAALWASYGYPIAQAQALLGAARCGTMSGRPVGGLVADAIEILTGLGAQPPLVEVRDTSTRNVRGLRW